LSQNGITSFCPTTMTLSVESLKKCFGFIADTIGKEEGAYIHGINMEGPFIAPEKKGAQAEEHILNPDFEVFSELNNICPVRLVDIAPERPGAEKFIEKAKKICTVSAAHTTANYETGKKAIESGVTHATHLYNAMNGLTSREAGMVGAVLDSDNVNAELICDGIHISPATLRITFKSLGEDRTVVISDAMMAAGLEDGEYTLGGQKVIKKDGAARLVGPTTSS
ncbi:MAG: N-acetylglucosamine-6-phosphate deacetylase, partial [Kiritimatiellae bacterium]|nr:N-acetylglucosamine-6-phosphate deacetylase [Kiritimatiellia bacterium]